ncbi:MAG: L,D-transpeptidase family protein [Sandaracinaceae bacterium]|nr:L,D-transpeptidase family protein [Sandaracinaceae bacterium]
MRYLIPIAMCLALGGCEDDAAEAPPDAGAGDEAPQDAGPPTDAGSDAGHDAGPPRPPARIFARRFVSKVRERPDRDAFRVGYLRAGAIMMATTGDPVRTDDSRCRGGWYELTTGGFVCNGRDVIAFWGRRPPEVRGAQPDRAAPLPYNYARNRRNNNPMYRNLPTDEQAAEFEGFHIPGQEPPPGEEGATAEGEGAAPAAPPPATEDDPDAEPEEEEPVTLASLAGERDSVLLRRMTNGMIVSLDRDFRAGPHRRRYWRTIHNGFVPYRTLAPILIPDFAGVRLDETVNLPFGWVMAQNEFYYLRSDDGRVRRGPRVELRERLQIVGRETIGTTDYFIAADGRLYRERDVRRIAPRARPDQIGEHDKWIEVNLSQQYLIAYEGDRPVFVTLISSGRAFHPDDPEANFLTPTGTFRIRAKHLAANMDGDTAADGPYSIDDVPYVMYFQLAYALHGAFWHRAFGFPRSHGCVNLAPRDAQWIFNWSDPQVPEGWHGAYPTESEPGTWIYIHGETPGQRSSR